MKKKLLFILLSLLTFAIEMSARNQGDRFTVDNINYQITDLANAKVQVVGAFAGAVVGGVLDIPASFTDPLDPNITWHVTSVIVNNSTGNTIPSSATTVKIPEGVTGGVTIYGSIQTVYLPSTVSSYSVRYNAGKLTNFIIPDTNPYLKFDASNGNLLSKDGKTLNFHCSNIQPSDGNFVIPEGIETVDSHSLMYLKGATIITYPSTLKKINKNNAYPIPESIEEIRISGSNSYFMVENGVLFKKVSSTTRSVCQYPPAKAETSFSIPDDVTSLESFSLKSVNLTSLDFNNVTSCVYRSLILPKLESITLSAGLTTFDSSNLIESIKITNINVEQGNTSFSSIDGVLFNSEGTKLVKFPSGRTGHYDVPESTTEIGVRAFSNHSLSSIKFDSNLHTIELYAFEFQNASTFSLDFSEVTAPLTIKNSAFNTLNLGSEIILPASLVSIEENAFYRSTFSKLTIPDGSQLTNLSGHPFYYSTLETVDFEGTCAMTNLTAEAFSGARSLTSINLPSTIKTIGDRAFDGCVALTSLTLPDDLENMGQSVFYGCTNLNTLTFPAQSKLKTIARNAFDGAPLTAVTLTEGVERVDAEAFINCDVLTSIDIPASLTNLDPEAFKFCNNLTAINVDENNPNYASVDGILMSKDLKTVLCFPAGKVNMSTLLPPTVEKIGDYAFYANNNLTNITLPAKVTEIGERAFGLCSNLNSITFLGSTMMDPAGINQAANKMSFDNGAADNITLNVRAAVKTAYETDPFYSTFDGVTPSSKEGHEEYIPMSETAAMLLSTDATDKVYKVPSTIGGYSVANIGDNAFDTTSGIEEVIVPATVTDLGFQAFKNSSVTKIYFLGDAVKVATEKYNYPDTDNEFNANQKVYVKRSQLATAKANMPRFANANQITNEVPYAAPTADFGTFSREFATDFSNGGTNTVASPKLIAFNTVSGQETKGDTDVFIINSITAGTDGTYIPANTGVIFKKYGTAPTYYEIAEDQSKAPVETFVVPVLEQTAVAPGTVSEQRYYIGKDDGKAHLINTTITIGAHKAYLKVAVSSPAKKIAFRFADTDDSATGINEVETASEKSEAIYNLNGQRVSSSARGILVRGGKKFVNK